MMAQAIPKITAPRSRLLYVQEDFVAIALDEQLVAGRTDLMLLRALDLEHGLTLARSHQPEVILIDLNLPGMPAVEFMKRLHAEADTATTPILALGASSTPADSVRALEAGFFLYLAKPLRATPFLEALAYALEFAAVERDERNPLKEPR